MVKVRTRLVSGSPAIQELSAFDLRCAVEEDVFDDCLWEGLFSKLIGKQ
jgi:hypothetical protein